MSLSYSLSRQIASRIARREASLQPHTVHGILQARILEWVAFPFSRGSSQPRDRTQVSRIAGGFSTSWATRETPCCLTWGQTMVEVMKITANFFKRSHAHTAALSQETKNTHKPAIFRFLTAWILLLTLPMVFNMLLWPYKSASWTWRFLLVRERLCTSMKRYIISGCLSVMLQSLMISP